MKKTYLWVVTFAILTTSTFALSEPSREIPRIHGKWRPGFEYNILIPYSTSEDLPPGKVEIRELFLYTSGWSKAIQPYLQKWLDEKGDRITFIREPAIAFPHAREQARLYYTLKAMGREDLHIRLFDFVREEHRYDVYHTIRRPAKEAILDMNIIFAERHGLDTTAFTQTYLSREIENQVIDSEIGAHEYALNGTSTIVINRKYSTCLQRFMGTDPLTAARRPDAADFEQFFWLIDELIEAEANSPRADSSAAPRPERGR